MFTTGLPVISCYSTDARKCAGIMYLAGLNNSHSCGFELLYFSCYLQERLDAVSLQTCESRSFNAAVGILIRKAL